MSRIAREHLVNKVAKLIKVSKEKIQVFREYEPDRTAFSIRLPNLCEVSSTAISSAFLNLNKQYFSGYAFPEKREEDSPIRKFLFDLNTDYITRNSLERIFYKKSLYGFEEQIGKNKKVIIEFSSPNIAKPFHLGHLRSTIIGAFLSNIHERLGYKCVKINYLGDWGTQYGLLAVGYQKYGNPIELERNAVKHLYDIYVKVSQEANHNKGFHAEARAIFRSMCSGNKELLDMWSNFRELSIHAYAQVYKRLHITFDHFEFESQMEAFLPKTLSELSRLNCIKKTNQGTGLYSDFNGKFSPAVLIKDDGTSVYLARDLAAVYSRLATYGEFDWMLYVVGHAQKIHFCQLFYLLKELGFNKNKFIHIPFGKVLGMSTRTGNSVFLEDIINKSKELVKNYMINNMLSKVSRKSIEEASEQLGISAVMVQDLKGSIEKSYEFSWERVLNFKGYTGIYLQYQYARLCSIERENKDIVIGSFDEVDMECLQGSYVVNITRLLDIFPEVVREALDRREPSKIVQYSLQLAKAFSSASKNLYVKDQPENIAKARLLLIGCTKTILQSCLELLNLKPLQKI